MTKSLIVCHIETSSGARFSIHADEEEFRTSLVDYNNNTLKNGEDDGQVDEDCSLAEVIDSIEDRENLSWEQIWLSENFFK